MRYGEAGEVGEAGHEGGRTGREGRGPHESRLEPMPRSQLGPEARRLYDAITQGPRASGPQHFALTREDGGLNGPFNAFLLSLSLIHI